MTFGKDIKKTYVIPSVRISIPIPVDFHKCYTVSESKMVLYAIFFKHRGTPKTQQKNSMYCTVSKLPTLFGKVIMCIMKQFLRDSKLTIQLVRQAVHELKIKMCKTLLWLKTPEHLGILNLYGVIFWTSQTICSRMN